MKTVLILLIILGITFAQTPKSGCVIFFKDVNYQGDYNECCESENNITSNNWKNRYSSVKLGANVETLSVYSQNDFEGNTLTYRSDQADLGPMNDDIQSYVVNTKFSDDCVRFWEHRYLMGDSWKICKSSTTISSIKQDKFNYVQFGSNIEQLNLYTKTFYTNEPNTNAEIKLRGGSFKDDSFRSLQIIHKNLPGKCAWLYEQTDFKGDKIELCNWTTDIGNKKNSISSIQFGSKVKKVQVFNQIDYQGNQTIYGSSRQSFDASWDNNIKSIKIIKN